MQHLEHQQHDIEEIVAKERGIALQWIHPRAVDHPADNHIEFGFPNAKQLIGVELR